MRFTSKTFAARLVATGISVTLSIAPTFSMAQNISPFQIRNYNPFVQIHGIPYIGEASTLAKGESRVNLIYALSSNYAIEQTETETETLLIDGESTNVTFSYARGIGKSLQLAVYLPYVKYDAGNLDGFINDWHETFNMQQGGRDLAPINRLRFLYIRNDIVQMDFVSNSEGLGDISLNAQLALGDPANTKKESSAVAINLKLPTGDSASFQGSGAFDLAVWYKHEKKTQLFDSSSGYFYSTGILFMGKGDVLPDMQKTAVFMVGGGYGLNIGKFFGLKAQLDYHSPFYSSTEFNELGGHSLQLVLGASVFFTKTIKLDLGLSEDLIIDASPDVVFHAAFSAEF